MNEPRVNLPELTVSELSAALKRTIEDAYGYVRVRGELGKVSYHGNGHVYFDLKDERACIAGVIWRSATPRIKLKLEAGLEVVVTGRLTTYPGRSLYQIIVETLEPAGLGALMALLEERKRRLAAEPSPCTRTGQTSTRRGKRSARRWRMSRMTAPLGEVMTPITRGRYGRSCFRASSNNPSAASRRLRSSSSAISAPRPAGSSVSTMIWYCERPG